MYKLTPEEYRAVKLALEANLAERKIDNARLASRIDAYSLEDVRMRNGEIIDALTKIIHRLSDNELFIGCL